MLNFHQHTWVGFWKHYAKLSHVLWLIGNIPSSCRKISRTPKKEKKKKPEGSDFQRKSINNNGLEKICSLHHWRFLKTSEARDNKPWALVPNSVVRSSNWCQQHWATVVFKTQHATKKMYYPWVRMFKHNNIGYYDTALWQHNRQGALFQLLLALFSVNFQFCK